MYRALLSILVLPLCSLQSAQSADSSSLKLQNAFKEQGGVCVILGATPRDITQLAGPLARNGKLTVHAIAADKADLVSLRKAAFEASPTGAIAVEQIRLSPFPYRTTLIDVLLIPDAERAKALGYNNREALKAIVPEGWVCTQTNGTWTLTQTPDEPLFDDWTHEDHGPDRNTVSNDKKVALPNGYRWNAGLPLNMSAKQDGRAMYFSTKTLVLNDGQIYTIADSELENLGPSFAGLHKKDQYLTARNAFNGMLLWRKKLFAPEKDDRVYVAKPVLVAVSGQVFAVQDLNHLMVLNGKTGELIRNQPTTYLPTLLVIDQGIAVVASMKNGDIVPGKKGAWGRPFREHAKGSLQAFNTTTGKLLWTKALVASCMLASEGKVVLIRKTPAGEGVMKITESVEALDLKTGTALWRAEGKPLKDRSKVKRRNRLTMDAASYGTVAVTVGNDQYTVVFNAEDGRVLFEGPFKAYTHYIDGRIYVGRSVYDPETGKQMTGVAPINKGGKSCTPRAYANSLRIASRGGVFAGSKQQNTVFLGARGSCRIGAVPAYGALYCPPNSCNCFPAQIPGYVVTGSNGPPPTTAEFTETPIPHLGSRISTGKLPETPEPWPTYRGNAERSNAYVGALPSQPKPVWTAQALTPSPETNITTTWQESLREDVTPAVCDASSAYVAITHTHRVQAYNQADGALKWTFTAGGRINSAPTLHEGLCLFGAFDGYLYAVHCSNGLLAWKMRVAPREE
ncbi:MAG: PQQ-binding-like beta-propeller repeat protein, partial [Lentisphaerae bacterium]|nr:PQQ-binding-like beta-propeller repeat protein [Lentisphaerota bacterium]